MPEVLLVLAADKDYDSSQAFGAIKQPAAAARALCDPPLHKHHFSSC